MITKLNNKQDYLTCLLWIHSTISSQSEFTFSKLTTETRCLYCKRFFILYFTTCSSISIANFEQVIVDWVCGVRKIFFPKSVSSSMLQCCFFIQKMIHSFLTVPTLYPPKTPLMEFYKTFGFLEFLKVCKMGSLARNVLAAL